MPPTWWHRMARKPRNSWRFPRHRMSAFFSAVPRCGREERKRRNRADGRSHQRAAAFSGICRGIAADRAGLANLDPYEGYPSFSGRLSCQLPASLWSFAAGGAWKPRAFRALELPSSPAGGGICRNRAATDHHGVVRLDVLRSLADCRKVGAFPVSTGGFASLPLRRRNPPWSRRARKEMAAAGAGFDFAVYLVGRTHGRRPDSAQRRNSDGSPFAVYGGVQFDTAERHGHGA